MRISDWSSDVCSSDLLRSVEERPRLVDVAALHGIADALLERLGQRGAAGEEQPGSHRHRQPQAEAVAHAHQQQRREDRRSEEHTSELPSLMRISYAVFCLKQKTIALSTHLSIYVKEQ